ncbi:Peptidoglycan-binding (PGRP) domain of peptidoglycan hydrolases-containing protein [Nocardioides exalbidus]|uniref:Peptidoglycan-binding (PGRP) domain of peptidoglycan hydrolases-containing protein n=1 Tax=Nocardioides exalbidus TaxID=402596 RepID=A0A1H4LTH2_9ACTN|nr:glycoside hydrolase domain-containing protein [Nocardioides exalbidus]SEB73966.1 Peptidoglycan-binding (PGRP) domain of peptidoglycan hydrolases-containing protein [Nocardioides exalbidus]
MRRLVLALLTLVLVTPVVASAPATAGEPASTQRLASKRQVALATPGDFTGYGFDQCLAPTQSAMDTWWTKSPYSAVGIYISGDSRACRSQPNLSPTWVATQVARGWRLLPIALGPQASCQPRFPRYKDDFTISAKPVGGYATAAAQGVVEADKNATDATAYGIGPGSTIWYDLEGFDLTNIACRESALVFTSAWVTRIKELGYVAGFYSSASSGIKMLDDARTQRPGQFALPDRIWIARWDGAANTSTTYIPEDGWRPGGRMKQYRGGHNETWGGVTINIDSNYIDLGAGSVARPEGRCPGTKLGFWKYPTLSPASAQATRVKVLQCLLTEQGAYAGPISGSYDAATIASARAWQAARRFTPTDTFEKRHWIALLSAGARTTIKRGSADESVNRLQRALNAAGAGKFRATGVFDAKTEAALKAYQSRLRIAVSGVATAQTWNKLQQGR